MPTTRMDEATQKLYERVQRQCRSASVPIHVVRRIAYALGGLEADFVDVSVVEERFEISGRVVVYAPGVVAVVDMEGVFDVPEQNGGAVRLTIRPRSSLCRIDVSDRENPELNTNAAWQPPRDMSRATDGWPRGTAVALTYSDVDELLLLPIGHPAYCEDFEAFMPALLRDLAA